MKEKKQTVLTDDKGVSEIIGVIMIFGILVLVLGILQSVFVPKWDQEIEAAHFNNIYDDTLYLRQVMQETSIFNLPRTVLVHASLDYPNRILLYNPPKPGLTISTINDTKIRIVSNGTQLPDINSCTIHIKENYNFFSAPELIIEHGMIIGNNGINLPYTIDGPPMNDKTINLYLIKCVNNSIGTTSSTNVHLLPESDRTYENVSSILFQTAYKVLWKDYLYSIKVPYNIPDGDENKINITYNNVPIRILTSSINV